jgi:predicted GIY-YIG superfamily endonuclease
MSGAWVYILRCADGSYYTGRTLDLRRRLAQHRSGHGGAYTKRRQPVELVYAHQLPSKRAAALAEQRIKKWTRARKEALIAGERGLPGRSESGSESQ